MKRTSIALAALTASVLVLTSCSGNLDSPTPSETQDGLEQMTPVVLRVSEIGPETGTPALGLQAFMDDARERTGGKIDFEPYFNATLAPPAESLAAIQSGLTDIGFFGATFNPQELPISFWGTNVARSVIGPGHPSATLVGSPATNALYHTSSDLISEFASVGLVPLTVMHAGPFPMVCVEPVESVEQAQGKVVATFGSPWKEELEAAGMTNVSIPPTDMYEALQRGVVDCVSSAANNIVNLGLMEVAKNLSLIDGSAGSGSGYAINKEVWDALPEQAQAALVEATAAFTREYTSDTLAVFAQMISEAERLGVAILDRTALNEVVLAQSKKVADGLIDSAPTTVADPEAFIGLLQEHKDHWEEVVLDELGLEPPAQNDTAAIIRSFEESTDAVDFGAYEQILSEYFRDLSNERGK